jgi:LacI family transcriptional regulator
MAKSNITINDIAKELNVASSTVSRALNNSNLISEKTKKKILDKASELGYDLNLIASSLSKRQSNIIGVLIPSINNFFYSQVVSGIEEMAYESGYRILITQSNDSEEREKEALRMLSAARVDGIIACMSVETHNKDHFERVIRNGTQLILFDRVNYSLKCHKIVTDNQAISMQAVAHLAKTGYNRIAFLGGPSGCITYDEFANGFKSALKKENLPELPKFSLSTDLTPQDISDATKIWFSQKKTPDAIITANSTSALQIAKEAKEANISIPEQLAILSLNSEPALEYVDPQISSVELPGVDIGKTAVQYIINESDQQTKGFTPTIKPFQLIIRNSTFRKL